MMLWEKSSILFTDLLITARTSMAAITKTIPMATDPFARQAKLAVQNFKFSDHISHA